ncbi:hypothetical protein BVRB_022940 [Beta vulgaris subsp. vulgaris]|uniref:Uncharacterized protein n=1 Tax=Beta vulgaris subsp. vulgaris TaxID=3555 RepID=A0A0J8AZY3_BETVV|nr:hypothetical protein BVRB_022940 [Beta vulgaris subsp. vulgaris]
MQRDGGLNVNQALRRLQAAQMAPSPDDDVDLGRMLQVLYSAYYALDVAHL